MRRPPRPPQGTGINIDTIQLSELRDRVKQLETDLARQTLLLQAMWQFVKAEFELEDEDLKALAEKLDKADGVLDGKATTPTVNQCPKCAEPVKGKRSSCFWCGHEFPVGLFGT